MSGLALVAVALVFSAWYAAPELRIERVPINDVVYHLTAAERMETAFDRGEPFLDPWVSEWALGYPVWLSYQPLPHVVAAVAFKVFRGAGDSASIFAWLVYLLIVFFPLSVYIGARLLGLSPPAAGLTSLLVFATAAPGGDLERFGIGYGSIVWRGAGLVTQTFGLHLMVLAVGMSRQALDSGGRPSRVAAAILLALTAVSHIVFGYTAFVTVAILAIVGPRGGRATRLVRLVTIALPAGAMLAWFVVPYVLAGPIANHSRWEPVLKWDSYGAPMILGALLRGEFFDTGRWPVITVLVAAGTAVAASRRGDALMRRALAMAAFWLVLFFGRATWGHLVMLAGVPGDLPMHRFQAVFEYSALIVAALGVSTMTAWLWARDRWLASLAIAGVTVCLVVAGRERAEYLRTNQAWGEQNLAAHAQDGPDLEAAFADVRAILAERPGRVSGGLSNTWGLTFQIGSAPIFAFLSRDHFDQPSFLYHSMSRASELMTVRSEDSAAHDAMYAIRAVVAPANKVMPPHLRLRSVHGRFAVYESSTEGYFGVVSVSGHYVGDPSGAYDVEASWLRGASDGQSSVVSLDARLPTEPALVHGQPVPVPAPAEAAPGIITREKKIGEVYEASVAMTRPGYAFLKITWNPDLHAAVDGRAAPVYQVTPGFGAVPVPAGQHDVTVTYQPGPLRASLFMVALIVPFAVWPLLGLRSMQRVESRASAFLSREGAALWRPSLPATTAVVLMAGVALHPLFRGQLVGGHDATAYLPRVVEMIRAIGDLHFPTVWAPDLSSGYGQPLFEFSPPLVYWMALPFHVEGFGLTDALQLGVLLLCAAGTLGVYRIARLLDASRMSAVGGAALWMFDPYLSLDLFVRSAYAEAAGIAVAPLALWLLLRAAKKPSGRTVVAASAGAALVLLAHNFVALLLLPAAMCAAAAYAWVRSCEPGAWRPTGPARLVAVCTAGLGALGLAAWFWVPALADVSNLHADRLAGGVFHLLDHLVYPRQLLWSAWGYGLSVAGPADGLSFMLGPVQLLLGVAGIVAGFRSRHRARAALALCFGFFAFGGALLSTIWMRPVWEHVALLHFFQFPWRALMLPGLFLPLLGVFTLDTLGFRGSMAAIVLAAAFNLPHTEPQRYVAYDEATYQPASLAEKGISATTQEEFEPRWSDARPPFDRSGLRTAGGSLEVTATSRETARQDYTVATTAPATVEAGTLYYPGWTAFVDGTATTVSPVTTRGTFTFALPAGRHRVVLELRRTPIIKASLLISLVTSLLLAALVVVRWERR